VAEDHITGDLILALINKRRSQRYELLEIIKYMTRVVMLLYMLRIKPFHKVSPILISVCGILENALSIAKLFKLEKRLVKLTKK